MNDLIGGLLKLGIPALIGIVLGGALLYGGLRKLGKLSGGEDRLLVRWKDERMTREDLTATTPGTVTKRQPTPSADMDTVCVGAPDAITVEDTTGLRPRGTSAIDAWHPTYVDTSSVGAALSGPAVGVRALWLPLVDGEPAVTVGSEATSVQTYTPTGKPRTFRYPHPSPSVRILPTVDVHVGPGLCFRALVRAELLEVPRLHRAVLEAGASTRWPSLTVGPTVGISLSPFAISF